MISVVIPLLNEEKSLKFLYDHLIKALKTVTKPYEIIFIDDGSTDKSLDILINLAKKDKNIRVFSFRRNQGKAEALTQGFQKAKGNYIVTLDADLQDRPGEIKKLYEKMQKGYDIVTGWRKDRKDKSHMVLFSRLSNMFIGFLFQFKLHDYNCGLKIYTRDAAKSLRLYGGLHRFIPLLAHQQGFRVTELEVSHDKRQYGKSKYGFSKFWKDLPDIFTMLFLSKYSKRPLHFFGTVGSMVLFTGIIILLYLEIIHTFYKMPVGDRPLLFGGILCVLAGLQIFFTGFLADLFISILQQSNDGSDIINYSLKYSSDKQ